MNTIGKKQQLKENACYEPKTITKYPRRCLNSSLIIVKIPLGRYTKISPRMNVGPQQGRENPNKLRRWRGSVYTDSLKKKKQLRDVPWRQCNASRPVQQFWIVGIIRLGRWSRKSDNNHNWTTPTYTKLKTQNTMKTDHRQNDLLQDH